MRLFVDTSVWSLALRRDAAPAVPEVAFLAHALEQGEELFTTGLVLQEGMTFTIEPMVNAGRRDVRLLPDGWTVITRDHSLSAQWEHTVLVTADGYEVLTLGADEQPPA